MKQALAAASYQCRPATSTGKMSLLISPPGHCQGGDANPANEGKREKLWEENGHWSNSVSSITLLDAVHLFFMSAYFPPSVSVHCH